MNGKAEYKRKLTTAREAVKVVRSVMQVPDVAHPDFREQLIKDAEAMNIWRRSNR